MASSVWLAFELVVLYAGVPLAMLARVVPRVPILVLLVAAGACAWALVRDPTFDTRQLWNAAGAWAHARGMLLEFGALAALLVAVVAWRAPDQLFDLVSAQPRLWALVMVLYPVLSVYPQEIIYRAFFAHRYAALLPHEGARVVAGAALFALGHVFFPRPWIAMSLTFVGGLLFAYHYEASGSLLLASIEHALFGQLLFTIGLGRYFYSGSGRRRRVGMQFT